MACPSGSWSDGQRKPLTDTPVVLIVGPRRAGKTTLVRKMGEAGRTYITLDDQTVLEAAQSDPAGDVERRWQDWLTSASRPDQANSALSAISSA